MTFGSDVYSSADGSTWSMATTTAAFGGLTEMGALVFNNQMWVIGGLTGPTQLTPIPTAVTNAVYSSTDGTAWTLAPATSPFTARANHSTVVFNNRMWVIGGYSDSSGFLNDVYSSLDGSFWTQATSNASFSPRASSGAVSFNSKIWLIGGGAGTLTALADIYSSTDGANWTLVTNTPPFGPRDQMGVYVFGGQIWVVGGFQPPSNSLNDAWYSSDGVSWIQSTSNAGFSARIDFGWAVYDPGSGPKMWLVGGTCVGCVDYNDVWHSP